MGPPVKIAPGPLPFNPALRKAKLCLLSNSKVSGFISVSKAIGISHKPIVLGLWILQGHGLVNPLKLIQQVFSLLDLQARNNSNMSEKRQKSEKIQLASGGDIVLKNFGKIHKFWSLESRSRISSLESRNFLWSLSLEVLTRSRSQLHQWFQSHQKSYGWFVLSQRINSIWKACLHALLDNENLKTIRFLKSSTWLVLGSGPALASAGPYLKHFCGAPLSGV